MSAESQRKAIPFHLRCGTAWVCSKSLQPRHQESYNRRGVKGSSAGLRCSGVKRRPFTNHYRHHTPFHFEAFVPTIFWKWLVYVAMSRYILQLRRGRGKLGTSTPETKSPQRPYVEMRRQTNQGPYFQQGDREDPSAMAPRLLPWEGTPLPGTHHLIGVGFIVQEVFFPLVHLSQLVEHLDSGTYSTTHLS